MITHGQCHIEPELVTALKQQAFLYGVVVLPSSDHLPEFVPLLDRSQIVSGDVLTNRAERQRRALDIVGDATRAAPRNAPPVAAVPSDPQQSRRMQRQPATTCASGPAADPDRQGMSVARTVQLDRDRPPIRPRRMVQQGRWVDAERHYRELIGQTHVINYEYDDWLRRLGEIYRHLGRPREAAFVYLYLHYFDMARAQLSATAGEPARAIRAALRARLAEIEKKWSDAAQLYLQAACGSTPRSRSSAPSSTPRRSRRGRRWSTRPGLAQRAVRGRAGPLQLRARRGAARSGLGRGAPRADREPAQARAGRRRLRAGRRARARVRLLPDPAQARQGVGAVREPRRGLRQLHPGAARRQPQVLRPAVLRGLHQARARARRAPRRRDAVPGGRGVRRARRAAVRPPLPAQVAR